MNSLGGTARVSLPDGTEDTFVASIGLASPIFAVGDGSGGSDLLDLFETGE